MQQNYVIIYNKEINIISNKISSSSHEIDDCANNEECFESSLNESCASEKYKIQSDIMVLKKNKLNKINSEIKKCLNDKRRLSEENRIISKINENNIKKILENEEIIKNLNKKILDYYNRNKNKK